MAVTKTFRALPYFTNLMQQKVARGEGAKSTSSASAWLRQTARKINDAKSQIIERAISKDQARQRTNMFIGSMYMFHYDPKLKETLPFYDKFPLVFPIEKYDDGFLGINLHYLPPTLRAKLMDALWDTKNNSKMTETTRLRISYQILKNASKYKYFRPCIKRYLTSHIRSRFMIVQPNEWEVAMFLPLERFAKASRTEVWSDSRHKIR